MASSAASSRCTLVDVDDLGDFDVFADDRTAEDDESSDEELEEEVVEMESGVLGVLRAEEETERAAEMRLVFVNLRLLLGVLLEIV